MIRVCILDYGSGNVKSVLNLIKSLTEYVSVSNDVQYIRNASHLVLPGVGAFGAAMQRIKESLPLDALEQALFVDKKPFLGICVGMQVMADRGLEFGDFAGLGWISGEVTKLAAPGMPLPHVGWNNLTWSGKSRVMTGIEITPDFYFVHSYAFQPKDPGHVVATTEYGQTFCSVVEKENLIGVQFHPEKSQMAGKKLLSNFLDIQ